jgi:2-hydroxy-3-keto-5-methylthiopentenyl-1-phosphate phosphatase
MGQVACPEVRAAQTQGRTLKASEERPSLRPGWDVAVLCDFDGTIVLSDTIGQIYHHFADPSCSEFVQRWIRGEISTQQELRACFGTIKASRAEMESLLTTIPMDPAFPEFLGFCQKQGYRFAIVSEGLGWCVDYVLRRHGICGITVYSNEIHFEPDGFRFSFPWYHPESPLRGVSKSALVRRYQAQGDRVVFIGDGLSDTDAVEVADVVYARAKLLEYCSKRGIQAVGFSDFADLLGRWVAL